MKLGPNHISMIGVGVSAVAAIAMVLYYRNQATQAAASSSDTSGAGAFPYFQTAALPSSNAGSGTTSAAPAVDVSALVTQLGQQQQASQQTSLMSHLGDLLLTGISQQSAQLSKSGGGAMWDPIQTYGYINPTASGGIQVGFANIPTSNIPQGSDMLKYIINPATAPNSTNSTPPPATVVH